MYETVDLRNTTHYAFKHSLEIDGASSEKIKKHKLQSTKGKFKNEKYILVQWLSL